MRLMGHSQAREGATRQAIHVYNMVDLPFFSRQFANSHWLLQSTVSMSISFQTLYSAKSPNRRIYYASCCGNTPMGYFSLDDASSSLNLILSVPTVIRYGVILWWRGALQTESSQIMFVRHQSWMRMMRTTMATTKIQLISQSHTHRTMFDWQVCFFLAIFQPREGSGDPSWVDLTIVMNPWRIRTYKMHMRQLADCAIISGWGYGKLFEPDGSPFVTFCTCLENVAWSRS
jgi:hypothetical protein